MEKRQFIEETVDILTRTARALVDHPDEVEIKSYEGEQTVVFYIGTAKGDLGQVIGKQGRVAHSIRTLISGMAAKNGYRAVLEIEE